MTIKQQGSALRRNINAGTTLLLFRKVPAYDFSISMDQLVWLLVLNSLLAFVFEFAISLPSPEFNSAAVADYALDVLLFLFAVYLVGVWLLGRSSILRLAIYIYSMGPFIFLGGSLLVQIGEYLPDSYSKYYAVVYICYLCWIILAFLWCITRVAGGFSRKVPAAMLVLLSAWLVPVYYYADDTTLWYASEDDAVDEYAAYRDLDVERLFYQQTALLDSHLQSLHPQRSGAEELYFVGFAGYAMQNIFRNEVRFAQQVFDERFDTRNRSLMLVNNLDTRDHVPLATSVNLERSLQHLGAVIDPEEDVVVIFLTSHGGYAQLSVDFWPLQLNDMTPLMLKQYLDEAGIKWRIIMVSACYSGSFIDTLKDDYTAIMTASSAEDASFGCDDQRELTYFGESLLQNQLQHAYSFAAAFTETQKEIQQREKAEKLTPSNPQIHIGEAMRTKLQRLEAGIRNRVDAPANETVDISAQAALP